MSAADLRENLGERPSGREAGRGTPDPDAVEHTATIGTLRPGRLLPRRRGAGREARFPVAGVDELEVAHGIGGVGRERGSRAHRGGHGVQLVVVAVAHNLDGDNKTLLRHGDLTAVLHHDLRADLRRACQLILQAQHARPGRPQSFPSHVQVVAPFNQPPPLPTGP